MANNLGYVPNSIFGSYVFTQATPSFSTISLDDAKESAPAIKFTDDTDTGLWSSSNGVLDFSTDGTKRLTITTSTLTSTLPIYLPNGSAGAPSYSFTNETDTGMYLGATDRLSFAVQGNEIFHADYNQFKINFTSVIEFSNATIGSNHLSFHSSDTGTGFYREQQGVLWHCIGGVKVLDVRGTYVEATQPIRHSDGAVGTPSLAFGNDSDTGFYRYANHRIGFSSSGYLAAILGGGNLDDGNPNLYLTTANSDSNGIHIVETDTGFGGSAIYIDNATPATTTSYYIRAFSNGSERFKVNNSGDIYCNSINVYGGTSSKITMGSIVAIYSGAGTDGFWVADNAVISKRVHWFTDGSASAPSITFENDQNTGIYRSATDTITFTTGGTGRVSINTANLTTYLPIIAPAGTVSLPSYTFNSDTNTGLYSYSADEIGVSCGGTLVSRFYNSGFIMKGNVFTDLTPSGGTLHWYLRTNGSSLRNAIGMAGTESSGDNGSNLTFWNYTDAGSFKAAIYTNERATNYNTFYGKLFAGGTASLTVPSIGFYNQTDCGFSAFYTDQIDFITNSVHRFSITNNSILPAGDSAGYNLGSGSLRFSTLYASTGTINTSDENLKDNITECPLGLDFIKQLQPKKYKWKNRTYEEKYLDEKTNEEKTRTIEKVHTRYHLGLIAQDVKATLDQLQVDSNDFAGYVDSSVNEPDKPATYGLNYMQFIAPLIKAVQELDARIAALENPE